MTAEVLVAGRPVATAVATAAARPIADVLSDLHVVDGHGLTAAEAATRLASSGPNAVVSHRVRAWSVLLHQLRSPLLGLLVVAALASYVVGEQSGAVIIVVIVGLSVGLGFVNEFRAEKAAEALHSGIRHHATVIRDGRQSTVDVTTLVPGDVATQTLVIFAIRTRRVPFFRSRPSVPLALAALGVAAVGAVLPSTPLAHVPGFQPLPGGFFLALAGLALAYLLLIELGKRVFYGAIPAPTERVRRHAYDRRRHLRRRAAHLGKAPAA